MKARFWLIFVGVFVLMILFNLNFPGTSPNISKEDLASAQREERIKTEKLAEFKAMTNEEHFKSAQKAFDANNLQAATRHLAALPKGFLGANHLSIKIAEQPKKEAALIEKQRRQAEKFEIAYRRKQGVNIGMTAQRVLESSWGAPESVNRTQNAFETSEQWVYGGVNTFTSPMEF